MLQITMALPSRAAEHTVAASAKRRPPASTEATARVEEVIWSAIGELLARRGASDLVIAPEVDLFEDLSMDSLELAELSAATGLTFDQEETA